MIKTGFNIGDHKWWVMAYLNVHTERDLEIVFGALIANGLSVEKANRAVSVLSRRNTGYTFSNLDEKASIICSSVASSYEEMFNTISHEIKHLTEHIGEFYGIDSTSESSAYLQGEIARMLYPAAAMVICPKCKTENYVGNNRQHFKRQQFAHGTDIYINNCYNYIRTGKSGHTQSQDKGSQNWWFRRNGTRYYPPTI